MHYTLTVCPCCQEVDIEPDYELELDEPKYEEAECSQCQLEESWFTETLFPF